MAWPTGAVSRANMDQGTDSPASARAQFDEAIDKLNTMIAHTEPVRKSGDSMTGDLLVDSIRVRIGKAGSGTGGNVQLVDDAGTLRFHAGILGTVGNRAYAVYDAVAAAQRLIVAEAGQVSAPVSLMGGSATALGTDAKVSARVDSAADVTMRWFQGGVQEYWAGLANGDNTWYLGGGGGLTGKLVGLTNTGDLKLLQSAPRLVHRTGGQDVGEVAFGTAGGRGTVTIRTRTTAGAGDIAVVEATQASLRLKSADGTCAIDMAVDAPGRLTFLAGGSVYFGSSISLYPGTDNAFSCGQSGGRWSAVWAANGTIQTSDPRLKTDVRACDLGLSLVRRLEPIRFRWIEGGRSAERVEDGFDEVEVEVDETQLVDIEVPVCEAVEVEAPELRIERIDGRPVVRQVKTKRIEQRPVGDWVEVLDERGHPVMRQVPAPTKRNPKATRLEPVRHFVPRTRIEQREQTVRVKKIERQPRYKTVEHSVPGKRTHYGFDAAQVKAALDAVGCQDFGGYVVGEDGTLSLRPDQFIPVLVRAVQELAARVEQLEGKK